MHPPGADVVLVRHGDLNTKTGSVRRSMEQRLVANLDALLADRGVEGTVEHNWSRPLVRTDQVEAATDAAADCFGVVSASPALAVDPALDAIADALAETTRACYDGGTYAVEARRAGDDLPFDSRDVGRVGGQAVADAVTGFEPVVDLDDPDVTFFVEVRESVAYLFLEKRAGPGGLPLGSQSPVVALVSGGIDSPVAAYEMLRRGCPVVPVYCDLGDYGGPDHEARAVETVRTLARLAPGRDMRVRRVDAGDLVADLAASMEQGRMLAFHRVCYAAAEAVAEREDADGVVTGEVVGQKSSQTARNLKVTSPAVDLPVHRPLLTWDKADVVERARAIGTFVDSTIDAGCNRLAPDQPETWADHDEQVATEPDDLLARARDLGRDAEVLSLPGGHAPGTETD